MVSSTVCVNYHVHGSTDPDDFLNSTRRVDASFEVNDAIELVPSVLSQFSSCYFPLSDSCHIVEFTKRNHFPRFYADASLDT